MTKRIFLMLGMLLSFHPFYAKVVLPSIFSDNMVLQRNKPIQFWGWADPGEMIEIIFNKQSKKTKADSGGSWQLTLEEEMAGGPYDLIIQGKNTILLKNVLVGEVWICSGQSNMEWTVGQSSNAKNEIAAATYSSIRHIKIPLVINTMPNNNFTDGLWDVCDSTTVANFTGAGYFFAKMLYDSLQIPIGLINTSWGGSNIETWISKEGFESSKEFKEMIAEMPQIDMDSMMKIRAMATQRRIETLQGSMPGDGESDHFKAFSLDDSGWPSLYQPKLWEEQELGELDGVVWLRKTFELSLDDKERDAVLELSKIDDVDFTYINGVLAGSTKQWDLNRKYIIPGHLLKTGKNTIAIKIIDTGGGGGIYGNASDVKLTIGQKVIPLAGNWKFQVESVIKSANQNSLPSLCFNAMINPLIPYTFQGVLWYQGESNVSRAYQYRKTFPLMINDWRQKWGLGDFPFYFVQLAAFSTPGNSNEGCPWAELREAQTMTLNQVPYTGMVVTTDIGDPNDIHPVNKQDVGKRLASIALNNLYGKSMVYAGPSFKSMQIEGNSLVLNFENMGSGLYTPDKYGYLKGFEVAGKDRKFYFARAYIYKDQVIVETDQVDSPAAVRFGWVGDTSECNLFNQEGFPAVPFRSDDWPAITLNEKYKMEKMQ